MKRYAVISLEVTDYNTCEVYKPSRHRLTGSYGTYDKEEEAKARYLELGPVKCWQSGGTNRSRHYGVAVITYQDLWEPNKQEKWHAVITYRLIRWNAVIATGTAYASRCHAEKVAASVKPQDPLFDVGVLPVRM